MPEGFRVATAWVSVSPNMDGFKEELKSKLDEATSGVEGKARVTLDTSELDAKADAARARVDELDGARAEPSVHLDDAGLGERADQARATLDELDSKSARPDIGLESSELDAQVDRAREKLDQLDGRRTEPRATLDTAEFDAKLDSARARLAAFNSESASARLGASGGAGGSRGGGEGSLAGALTMGIGALLPGLGGASAGLGLAGLTGALGLGGIGKALSAAHQSALNVGLTQPQLAATQFGNSVQNQQAQDQLTQARRQAAQDAITSAKSIEQAQMSLAGVERNAAQSQVQALQSVTQAQQGVEQADYALSEAQYNLNQAWEAAREQIRQLDDQLADSKLNIQSAQLAIQQAMYQQRLTNQNAYSTSLDRQQAALAVARAQQQLTDAQDQETSAAYAANLAHQQGVDGSQTVIQAKQGVTAATYQQQDAHAQSAMAQTQLTNTQLNNTEQIRQAQMQLAATEEQAAYQRQSDARNIAIAERNVVNVLQEQQLQMAATMSTSNQSANQFAADMARLSQPARDVVNQILGMKTAFKQVEDAAQAALAPGLLMFLQGLSALMPGIQSGVTTMGGAISDAFTSMGKAMQSKGAQDVFSGLVTNGIQFAKIVVPAFAGFVGELGKIGAQKGAADGLANLLAGFGHGLSGLAASIGKYQKPINDFLSAAGAIIAQIGPPLGAIIGLVAQALQPLTQYLDQHPNGIVVKVLGDIVAGLIIMKGLKSVIPDVLLGPLENLGDKASKLLTSPFKNAGNKILESISGQFKPGGLWDDVRLRAWYKAEDVGGKIAQTVSGWGSSIATAVKGVMPTKLDAQLFMQSVKDTGSTVASTVSSWGSSAMTAARSVGTSIVSGLSSGVSMLSGAGKTAWQGLTTAVSAAGTAAQSAVQWIAAAGAAAYEAGLKAITATAAWIGQKVATLASAVADGVMTAAQWLLNTALDANPIALVVIAIAALVAGVIYAYTHFAWFREVVQGALKGIEIGALWLWHNVFDPMWQGIAAGGIWLYQNAILPLYHGITDAFHWIDTEASWLKDHVFAPLWKDVQTGADAFLTSFKTSWGSLEEIFKVPVNFLISTVYTQGIEALWNGVVGAIGDKSLKLPDIAPFAQGGVVPGYAPGRDTVPAVLSPGEGVLVPEAVRAIGPGTVLALNAAYGGGRVSTPGHYKGGGIIGSLWNDVTGGASKALDVAKIVAAVSTGNTSALNNALTKLVGTNAVGSYGKLMLGVPTTLIHDAVAAVGALVGGGKGGGTSSAGPVSGSVAQWFADAVQAASAPAGWIPDLETIGRYESSDDANAINLTDSNAAAGDPSRGIMQTIMSTFNAYHQPGTSNNIYDPVANIAAGINYIRARYGSPSNVPGIRSLARGGPYVGYDSGGWLMPGSMPVNGLGKPEAVLTPAESQAFVQIVRQLTSRTGAPHAGAPQAVINFNGTQYPNAEQMAAIKREMALALSTS